MPNRHQQSFMSLIGEPKPNRPRLWEVLESHVLFISAETHQVPLWSVLGSTLRI